MSRVQQPFQVRLIPLSENQPLLNQAGDDVGTIWEYYRNPKGNFSNQSIAVYHRYGAFKRVWSLRSAGLFFL
jgi:hypothetical protein